MTLNPSDMQKHIEWLRQFDIHAYLTSGEIAAPWFPAFQSVTKEDHEIRWFAALVSPDSIRKLIKRDGWDIGPADGGPAIWTHYRGHEKTRQYCPFGNEDGVEPIVILRSFHGIHHDFLELAQEFQMYCNLYPDPGHKRFIHIDRNGDESEAVRYGDKFMEVRTDLLRRFCAAKQMALAIYVESFRYSRYTLAELGLTETRTVDAGDYFRFPLAIVPDDLSLKKKFETCSLVIGGKKYVRPGPMPLDDESNKETFQEFIIGTGPTGKHERYLCDPNRLANYFGANPDAPHYLTPVFFRAEVLSKYYADPAKYSVEDGYLRCGGLWGLRMDNDHADYVVVWLGDLGRDISENERNYWLSFNIPPEGRKISVTNFKRDFMAEPTDPVRPDLAFKHEYTRFNHAFRERYGWEFFLPLHPDDEHFFTGLRLPAKDSPAEFDSQLLALTKVLVDSINEKMISIDLTTLTKDDKSITKLEKWFLERGLRDYEPHIKFLRVLQDLRSKAAVHRKGSNYDKLVAELQIADEGQQRVFFAILNSACALITYLESSLLSKESE